MDVPQREVPWV